MQIFNDKKKRIGTLSGFKNQEITTTLDSGDKELSFSYPTAGALVDLLKEEYYIRTKTDEYVIKAVEKGEQFNKYTAVLNVEELEGTPFPYGFESQEQTMACRNMHRHKEKNYRRAGKRHGMGCPAKVPHDISLRVHHPLSDKNNRHI